MLLDSGDTHGELTGATNSFWLEVMLGQYEDKGVWNVLLGRMNGFERGQIPITWATGLDRMGGKEEERGG